MSDSVFMPAV